MPEAQGHAGAVRWRFGTPLLDSAVLDGLKVWSAIFTDI